MGRNTLLTEEMTMRFAIARARREAEARAELRTEETAAIDAEGRLNSGPSLTPEAQARVDSGLSQRRVVGNVGRVRRVSSSRATRVQREGEDLSTRLTGEEVIPSLPEPPPPPPLPEVDQLTPPPVSQTPLFAPAPAPVAPVPASGFTVPPGFELVPIAQPAEPVQQQQQGGLDPLTILLFSMLFNGGGGGFGGQTGAISEPGPPTSFTPNEVPQSDLGSVPGGSFNNFGSGGFNQGGGVPFEQLLMAILGSQGGNNLGSF